MIGSKMMTNATEMVCPGSKAHQDMVEAVRQSKNLEAALSKRSQVGGVGIMEANVGPNMSKVSQGQMNCPISSKVVANM